MDCEWVYWDWRAQPDWERIDMALSRFKRPTIMTIDDTGSDSMVALITERGLTKEEAQQLFWEWALA